MNTNKHYKHFLLIIGLLLLFIFKTGFAQEIITPKDVDPNYGKYRAGDFLLYFGAGYANDGFYSYKENKNIYTTKNPIVVPPISFFMEYSLLNFFAIGSEFTYFRYKPIDSESGEDHVDSKRDMFMFKFRGSLHHTFSIVDLYLGGSIGMYSLYTSKVKVNKLFGVTGISQFTFSGFVGLRFILGDRFFLFAETGYPFPLFMGGIGFKF